MKRFLKGLGRFTLFALLGLAGLLALFITWLRSMEPKHEGVINVAGLNAPVTIARDAHGIPHITGASEHDVFFAMGFTHAQDRLWQMDFIRRAVRGRLSEAFGSLALEADTLIRTIGLSHAADQAWNVLDAETRAALEAYAAGVNAYLEQHQGPWPPEFEILGLTPQPWQPTDSIAAVKMLAVGLSTNAFAEINRARLLQSLTPEQLGQLQPPAIDADALQLFRDSLQTAGLDELYEFLPKDMRFTASNNWVIDGTKSATGMPILANDPHLGMNAPTYWYLAHLAFPDNDVVGATFPGTPFVILGRNRQAAWGFTNTGADVQDIFVERLGSDPNTYETPDGPRPFETRSETINVRFGDPVTIEVRATRHGPVLPDLGADGPLKFLRREGQVLALSWTALTPDDRSIGSAYHIKDVADWNSFREVMRNYVAPVQSIVFAARTGEIGLLMPGRIPLRNSAGIFKGLLPAPGWTGTEDWMGFVPFDQNPQWVNPANGWFATANDQLVPDDWPYAITREWDAPFRGWRIAELLEARSLFGVEDMTAMQMDIYDRYAEAVLPKLLPLISAKPEDEKALAALRAWNFAMEVGRAEPLLFAAFMRAFSKAIYADELGDDFNGAWSYRTAFMWPLIIGAPSHIHWCDDVSTAEANESCADRATHAFAEAMASLRETYGDEFSEWRWGEAHNIVNNHWPFGFVPVLRDLYDIRVPFGGGGFTLARADHRFAASEPYAGVHGSGYRAVYDLSSMDNSRYMIATGQSGIPHSPHYDDLAPIWADGGYVMIPSDPARYGPMITKTLVLHPSGAESAR